MERSIWPEEYRRIIAKTLDALPPARRQTTNLYVDLVPYAAGEPIGPAFQKIIAPGPSHLVFADENPRASFGHDCRYWLYDKSMRLAMHARARFPPFRHGKLESLRVVHEPVYFIAPQDPPSIPLAVGHSDPNPQRQRFAILFSGTSDRYHLNDLEYCYRMLTGQYGFAAANIFVLCSDMTMSLPRGRSALNWPDENFGPGPVNNEPYQMKARFFAKGDRDGFKNACQEINKTLQKEDLVFIQTSGHGDAELDSPYRSYLLQHDEQRYFSDEFCDDLKLLGKQHDSLLILMEQCFSNGFKAPLLNAQAAIKAKRLSIACASAVPSFPTLDGLFMAFGRGWIASHMSNDPYGTQPMALVDTNNSGAVEAKEAYEYALDLKDPFDQPIKGNHPSGTGGGKDIRLTEKG
jgi:hypothetical protein